MARRTNIRRSANGRWFVYFRVEGKQTFRRFRTREEAELFLSRSQVAKAQGEYRPPARVLFEDAAAEWFRHRQHDKQLKRSTLIDYRSALAVHLGVELDETGAIVSVRGPFAGKRLEAISAPVIERWRSEQTAAGVLPRRTAEKVVAILHGIFERARKAYGVTANPVADVERHPKRYSGDYAFLSPEEVLALVRAAESPQDAAIFLTAAFTGLRQGELVALRWRDVDFTADAIRVRASFTKGSLSTPKSGKVRSVPMVPEVARALASLGQRDELIGDDDLVFPGADGYLDASALRRRYIRALATAGVRAIRFHDLRHTFGSLAIRRASIVQVQEWMGHADMDTTRRYLHHRPRADDAQLLADAFRVDEPAADSGADSTEAPDRAAAFHRTADGETAFVGAERV